jgi:hypothetical protein
MSCASLNTQGGTAAAGLTETLLQRTGMAIIIDEVSHQSPWSSHKKKKQAGVLGYFFNKMKFQLAPLVVGLILGPNIEKHFREALFLSQGDRWIYVESPIAVAIWLLVAAILIAGFIARRRAAFAEAMAQDSSEAPSRQRRPCLPRRSLGVDGSRPSTCFPRDSTCMLAARRVGGALGHSVMSAYVSAADIRINQSWSALDPGCVKT